MNEVIDTPAKGIDDMRRRALVEANQVYDDVGPELRDALAEGSATLRERSIDSKPLDAVPFRRVVVWSAPSSGNHDDVVAPADEPGNEPGANVPRRTDNCDTHQQNLSDTGYIAGNEDNMENSQEAVMFRTDNRPTAKEKSAVQRAVNRLLDGLAPERVIKRTEQAPARVEQHRTPAGCVLQARNAAVSVSWFSDRREQTIGELHVNVWKGTVSRGGVSYRKPERAVVVEELVLKPVSGEADTSLWRTEDGREFDTPTLQAHCLELLETQIEKSPS